MSTLVLIIVVVAVVAIGYAVWRRAQASRRADAAERRDAHISTLEGPGAALRALGVRDVVGMDGAMWIVEGTLRFDEDGFLWQEHLLVDGNNRTWLSVEDDEGRLVVARWQRLRGHGLAPGAERVEHDGTTFTLHERGRAGYRSEGSTGAPSGGRAEYADYRSGDRLLGFERYGDDASWEASVGTEVPEHALDVYPGRSEEARA